MTRDAVLKALETLPIIEESQADVELWAGAILLAATITRFEQHPSRRTSGTNAALKQLDDIASQCDKLFRYICNINATTIDAIGDTMIDGRRQLAKIHGEIGKLGEISALAAKYMRSDPPANGKRGRPFDQRAFAITDIASRAYTALTAQPVKQPSTDWLSGTRTGPFKDFLALIFVAVDVNASPASRNKHYVPKMGKINSD